MVAVSILAWGIGEPEWAQEAASAEARPLFPDLPDQVLAYLARRAP
jgi:hypothetical protein